MFTKCKVTTQQGRGPALPHHQLERQDRAGEQSGRKRIGKALWLEKMKKIEKQRKSKPDPFFDGQYKRICSGIKSWRWHLSRPFYIRCLTAFSHPHAERTGREASPNYRTGCPTCWALLHHQTKKAN